MKQYPLYDAQMEHESCGVGAVVGRTAAGGGSVEASVVSAGSPPQPASVSSSAASSIQISRFMVLVPPNAGSDGEKSRSGKHHTIKPAKKEVIQEKLRIC